jgi:aspartate racemase
VNTPARMSTTPTASTTEIIGILGGMGPAATADFYAKLVSTTPGVHDQDHLRTVIWSDPTIPDRTEALLGDGPDPTPWLLDGSRVLR